MAPPLLQTKLYIPRPRLIERLNAGLHRKLTLVHVNTAQNKALAIEMAAPCCRSNAWGANAQTVPDPYFRPVSVVWL